MKYILDDRKIIKYLVEEKIAITSFAAKAKVTPATLNRAMNGDEVSFSTVVKISNALNVRPEALILASIKTKSYASLLKDNPPSRPYNSVLAYRHLKENRYGPQEF